MNDNIKLTPKQIRRSITYRKSRIKELLEAGCPEDAPIIQMHRFHIAHLEELLQASTRNN